MATSGGTLTFDVGQTTQTISIDIPTNSFLEFNEDFKLTLSNPQGSTTENAGATNESKIDYKLGDVSESVVTIQLVGTAGRQPAGALDLSFNADNSLTTVPPFNQLPGANKPLNALAVQPDGKVILGGEFTAYNASVSPRLTRVLTNGFADPLFDVGSGADKPVTAVAVYINGVQKGKIVVAGAFTSINGTQRNSVALLNSDGTLDANFDPGSGADGPVYSMALQADGNIVLGGDFSSFNGFARQRLVRLLQNGQVDTTFDPGSGPDGPVYAIGATFPLPFTVGYTNANGRPATNLLTATALASNGVIRLTYTLKDDVDELRVFQGTDLIYTTGPTNTAVFVTNDDSTITTNFVSRVANIPFGTNSSTVLGFLVMNQTAATTNDTANTSVIPRRFLLRGNDRYFCGRRRSFSTYQGQQVGNIAQLKLNGVLDPASQTGIGTDGTVNAIAIDSVVRPVLGGSFSAFNSVPRQGLVRLTKEGAIDKTFDSGNGPNDTIYSIALQRDGNILIGGAFTSYNATRRRGVARLYEDGSLDTTFLDTAYNEFAGLVDPSGGANGGQG